MSVTIYTRPGCGYCISAKALLDRKGVTYREIDIMADTVLRDEMVRRSGGQQYERTSLCASYEDRHEQA